MAIYLPERWRDKISTFPEHSYGVSLVTLVLDDGSSIRNVRIAWNCEVLERNNPELAHLDPLRIVDVESDV